MVVIYKLQLILFLSIFVSGLLLTSWHYDFEKISGAPFNIRAFVYNMYFEKEMSLNHFWESAGIDIAHSPNGGKYSGYPPGAAFITLPFFFIQQVIAFLIIKIFGYLNGNIAWIMESFFLNLPSILVASLSSVIMFDILKKYRVKEKISFLVAWAFFFTSFLPAYTTSIHYNNLSMFFGLLAVWIVIKPEGLGIRKPFGLRNLFFAGLSLGLAGITEYVTALFIVPVILYLFSKLKDKKRLLHLLIGYALPVSVLLYYNYVSFGLPFAFSHQFVGGEEVKKGLVFGLNLPQGLFGLYLSPLRGLFFYAPLSLLAITGVYRNLKEYKKEIMLFLSLIIIPSLVYSFWKEWWGGWSYGPRFLLSTLPYWSILSGLGLKKLFRKAVESGNKALSTSEVANAVVVGIVAIFGYFSGFVASLNGVRSKVQVPTNTYHPAFWEKIVNVFKGITQGDSDRFTSLIIRLKNETPGLASVDTRLLIYIYLILILVVSIFPLIFLRRTLSLRSRSIHRNRRP